jgi:hypothetical protein
MVYAFLNTTYIFIINLGINEKGFTNINFIQYNLDNDFINNYNKKFSMNPTQLAQQVISNYQKQAGTIYNTPPVRKPIFVMRVPSSLGPTELKNVRDALSKDSITDDYHVVVVPSSDNDFGFEMYNADKIETQKWNELVNRILK